MKGEFGEGKGGKAVRSAAMAARRYEGHEGGWKTEVAEEVGSRGPARDKTCTSTELNRGKRGTKSSFCYQLPGGK